MNLSEQVGPLPLGGWLLAIGGGLGFAWWTRRSSSPAPAPAPSDGLDGGNLDNTQPGAGNLGATSAAPSAGGAIGTPAVDTNEAWQILAERTLIGHGFDPLLTDRALADYLGGNPLDIREQAVVAQALVDCGPPPQPTPAPLPGTPLPPVHAPVPPPSHQPGPQPSHQPPPKRKPAPKPPAKPAATYTVRSGDTLSGIAAKLGTTAAKLYAKNAATIEQAAHAHGRRSSDHGHWIYPGTRLRRP